MNDAVDEMYVSEAQDYAAVPEGGFGRFVLWLVFGAAFASALGYAFLFLPAMGDLGWRICFGVLVAIALAFVTVRTARGRLGRMLAGLVNAAAFAAGYWLPWAIATFGAWPGVAQMQRDAAAKSYSFTSFGEPVVLEGFIFEAWVGLTFMMMLVPFIAGLAKPAPKGSYSVRQNSFARDLDNPYQNAALAHLTYPALGFAIAAGGVWAFNAYLESDWGQSIGFPVQAAFLSVLVPAGFMAAVHVSFRAAMVIAALTGLASVIGFWLPWAVMELGTGGAAALFSGDVVANIKEVSLGYGYVTSGRVVSSDWSRWTYQIWMGMTLCFLILPAVVILTRRYFNFVRMA